MRKKLLSLVLLLSLCCVGCAPKTDGPPRFGRFRPVPDAVPQAEPLSRIGNSPYTVFGTRYYPMSLAHSRGYTATGVASWYGSFFHGRQTSNGEVYDLWGMTAAHKTLPLPTYVRVTNLKNGRQVVVKVNDRGPFHEDRLIDLSYAAAQKLDMHNTGTANVRIEALHVTEGANHTAPLRHGYYIQVASFRQPALAQSLAHKMRAYGKAEVHRQDRWHKVLLGPFHNIDTVDTLVGQLRQKGFSGAHLVQG